MNYLLMGLNRQIVFDINSLKVLFVFALLLQTNSTMMKKREEMKAMRTRSEQRIMIQPSGAFARVSYVDFVKRG